MQTMKNLFTYFSIYNKQIKVGSYVYSYVGGRNDYPIICKVEAIEGELYRLKNVKTGRVLVRNIMHISYLPNFEELPQTNPELFI